MPPKNSIIKNEPRIDLACGQNKREGFFGIDYVKTPQADRVHNLMEFPWPIADSTVDELHCSHYVEHIPMIEIDGADALCRFMDEAHRVMRKPTTHIQPGDDGYHAGGVFTIIHPYLKSVRAFQDPTHRRYIPEQTWHYFNSEWRRINGLDHYRIACDWEVVSFQFVGIPDDVDQRHDNVKMMMLSRDWDVIGDLYVTLRAR